MERRLNNIYIYIYIHQTVGFVGKLQYDLQCDNAAEDQLNFIGSTAPVSHSCHCNLCESQTWHPNEILINYSAQNLKNILKTAESGSKYSAETNQLGMLQR